MTIMDPTPVHDPLRARGLTEALVLLRHRSGKDQRELSDLLAARGHPISSQAISAWENGKRMTPMNLRVYIEVLTDLTGDDSETVLREVSYWLTGPTEVGVARRTG
jgi:transcriptional regulator with XRE-family HTH domain